MARAIRAAAAAALALLAAGCAPRLGLSLERAPGLPAAAAAAAAAAAGEAAGVELRVVDGPGERVDLYLVYLDSGFRALAGTGSLGAFPADAGRDARYPRSFLEVASPGGSLRALPLAWDQWGIAYDEAAFAASGLAEPKGRAELDSLLGRLAKASPGRPPLAYAGGEASDLYALACSIGAGAAGRDEVLAFLGGAGEGRAKAFLEPLAAFAAAGYAPPRLSTMPRRDAVTALLGGSAVLAFLPLSEKFRFSPAEDARTGFFPWPGPGGEGVAVVSLLGVAVGPRPRRAALSAAAALAGAGPASLLAREIDWMPADLRAKARSGKDKRAAQAAARAREAWVVPATATPESGGSRLAGADEEARRLFSDLLAAPARLDELVASRGSPGLPR